LDTSANSLMIQEDPISVNNFNLARPTRLAPYNSDRALVTRGRSESRRRPRPARGVEHCERLGAVWPSPGRGVQAHSLWARPRPPTANPARRPAAA
jgi:hypothetical protein